MISIGMKLSPAALTDPRALVFSGALILVGILSKWSAARLVLRGRPDLDPLLVSWGLVPREIPGFAFASAAVHGDLIAPELFTILVLVVSVTTWVGLVGIEVAARRSR